METTKREIISTHQEMRLNAKRVTEPELGDLVLGQIINVGDKIATAIAPVIFRIKRNEHSYTMSTLRPPFPIHANIFKSDVAFSFVNLSDIIKTGDLVLGRVKIAWFKPIFISLDTEETGVLSGLCSNCGSTMPTPPDISKQTLFCPRCGGFRRTKISTLYNPMLWREIYHINKIKTLPPL